MTVYVYFTKSFSYVTNLIGAMDMYFDRQYTDICTLVAMRMGRLQCSFVIVAKRAPANGEYEKL